MHSHGGDFQHHMETTSCFSYFYGDVIDCCSTLPLCVCFITGSVWYIIQLTMPRLSAPPLGMAKLFQQRPSWTRLQTNVKVCEVVSPLSNTALFDLSSMYREISWSAPQDFQHLKREYHFLKNAGRHPMWEFYQNIKSCNSYAVVSDDPGQDRKQTARLLKAASQLMLF